MIRVTSKGRVRPRLSWVTIEEDGGRESWPGRRRQHRVQRVELLQALPRAKHHRLQRLRRCHDGHPRLVGQTMVYPHQKCSSSSEHNASFDDVGSKLRRRLVEGVFDCINDRLGGLLDCLPDLRDWKGEWSWEAHSQGRDPLPPLTARRHMATRSRLQA